MSLATMSILGLYRYDPTIFDDFQIPDGIDRETVIDSILLEFAELEILYPSASMMKLAIASWSKKKLWQWEELYKTTQYEYDPIYNYDRYEKWTDKEDKKTTFSNTSNGTSNGTGHDESTGSVSGYDSSGFTPSDKTVSDSTSGTTANSSNNGESTDDNTIVREGRAYGNIGVTTTQQMIESQRDVLKFNIIDAIVQDFGDRFCIGVW